MRTAALAIVAFVLVALILLAVGVGYAVGSDVYRTRVRIENMGTWDAKQTQFYLITFADKSQATLSVDPDAPVARELQSRLNRALVLTLEPPELER